MTDLQAQSTHADVAAPYISLFLSQQQNNSAIPRGSKDYIYVEYIYKVYLYTKWSFSYSILDNLIVFICVHYKYNR